MLIQFSWAVLIQIGQLVHYHSVAHPHSRGVYYTRTLALQAIKETTDSVEAQAYRQNSKSLMGTCQGKSAPSGKTVGVEGRGLGGGQGAYAVCQSRVHEQFLKGVMKFLPGQEANSRALTDCLSRLKEWSSESSRINPE